jgi:HAD superfamily hydrolase (TIGR01509 family)
MNYINSQHKPAEPTGSQGLDFPWAEIEKVFLDLDGTLLDRYFDDYFWEQFVVETYSRKNSVDPEEARGLLLSTYKSVESTLKWTDLDYWSEQLDLDIPGLKHEIRHLIRPRPHVIEFLDFLQGTGKTVYLVTNAHPTTIRIKMNQVDLTGWFHFQVCSKDMGAAKEQLEFWHSFEKIFPFDKETTLFVDDNENVLNTARQYGIKHLVHIATPSSRESGRYHQDYISIGSFQELILMDS